MSAIASRVAIDAPKDVPAAVKENDGWKRPGAIGQEQPCVDLTCGTGNCSIDCAANAREGSVFETGEDALEEANDR